MAEFSNLLPLMVATYCFEGNEENLALYICNYKSIEDLLRGLGDLSGDPLATL